MDTTNDSIEKKCYFDYLVKKYTALSLQKEQEEKAQYNTAMLLTNTQPVAAKAAE